MATAKQFYISWLMIVCVVGQSRFAEEDEVTVVRAEYCPMEFECSLPFTTYADASPRCSCHPACPLFGDCCYEVEAYDRHEETPNVDDAFFDAIGGYAGYFQCTTDIISREKYWMVSSCPSSWPVPNNCDHKDMMMDGNFTYTVGDLQDLTSIPIISADGITFRNIYCAVCHGQDIDTLIPWSLEAACDNISEYRSQSNSTLVEKVENLIDACDSVSFVPPISHSLNEQAAVPCRMGSDVLYTCGDTSSNDESFGCSTILAPIEIDFRAFKNLYCAKCFYNTGNSTDVIIVENCNDRFIPSDCLYVDGYLTCGGRGPPIVPISITFDFGSVTGGISVSSGNEQIESVFLTCEEGEVFDPTSFECLRLGCPDGYILQKNRCLRNGSVPTCEGFLLNITMELPRHPEHRCYDNLTSVFELFLACLPEDILDILSDVDLFIEFSCVARHVGPIFTSEIDISPDQVNDLFSPKDQINNSYSESCQSSKIVFTAECISPGEQVCEHFMQNNLEWSIVDSPDPTLFFRSTNQTLDAYAVRFRRDLHFAGNGGIVEHFYLQDCRCPLVTLDATQFYDDESASNALIYAGNESIRFSPSMYIRNGDGSISVCNFFESAGEIPRFFPEYSLAQSILSTVGISLSVVALAFSLITYCLFPELRNRVAPILIMNLCGCLIVAQVCLLFAGVAASSPIVCAIITGTGHFFWLAVFASSTLVGVSLTRAFSLRNQTDVGEKPSCTTSLIYIMGCFVVPVAVSGTLLTLYIMDEDGKYSITYGDFGVCWIGNSTINIFAFGLPVATFLTLNFVLFAYIVFSLCVQHRQSRRMNNSVQGAKRREFLVYTRIFVILGLTWVSGFVASFTGIDALWYVFIVLTSLQGVFIFTAFAFKARVYGLWKKKLCKQSPSRPSKSTSSEVSSRTPRRSRAKMAADAVR